MNEQMTNSKQKVTERFFLNRYIDLRRISPLDITPSERPGFIIKLNDSCWGVEVTTYSQPKTELDRFPRREVEEGWERIREHAGRIRRTCSELKNVCVLTNFKAVEVPRRNQIEAFVEQMIQIIRMHRETINSRFIDVRPTIIFPLLQRFVASVSLKTVNVSMDWESDLSFGGVGTSDDELIGLFDSKLTTRFLREGIERYVLLTGGETIYPSSFMCIAGVEELVY